MFVCYSLVVLFYFLQIILGALMDQQNLASKGILLEDDKTVGDYGINK
jgi:hypothetical protein